MAGTELLLRQELSGARRSLLRLLGLLGILGASGVVLGVFAIRRMAHRITEPLSSLARASSELAQGNRSVRVSISSGDELEQLAETFNAMADANERAMRDLEVKTAEALESSRLKSEFLANMSHEIRTPMNGILGVARLARSLPLEGKLRRYVETIDSSASSLMTIINDVLDFSKMEAGKYSLNPVIFDLRTVVQEVCELLATRASDKGLDLIWHIDPTMASLHRGDPDRLRQIISNLVGNAIKFTDRGEVRVDVSVVERRTEGERLRIAIIDTGIGIAKADIPKLFDSFSQLDGSMSRRFGGTGLGLAISKRLVEMMGGTMGVASELGRGSEFSCELRLETAAAGPQDSRAPVGGLPAIAAPPGLPALVSARVLVVDDNEVNLFVAVEMLEQMGYQVETAKNGAEAVEMAQRGDFAVILMDCQMPVMDGYAATREIRRAEEGTGAHQTILALTAHALSGERERVLSAGMDDYLSKPVRPSSLDKMIRRHARAGARAVPQESAASAAPQKASLYTTISRSGKLIDLFLKNIPGQLDAIEGAARSGQAADLRAHAHKAKGSCLALGAATMAHTAETLQKLAETGSVDGSLHLVAAMRQQYVEVAGLLARERARS
jgi:signal transduction histidine kinase/CheY-like chemotaxis protein